MGICLTATHNDKIFYQNEGEQLAWYEKVSTAEPLAQQIKDNSIADSYQYTALNMTMLTIRQYSLPTGALSKNESFQQKPCITLAIQIQV